METSPKGDGLGSAWFFWRRRRYLVALLSFIGFLTMQSDRINLSITIIAMTTKRSITLENGTITEEQDFNWDSKVQGHLLSAFFYGYVCTQVIGGWLAARVGGKHLFGFGVAGSALLTVLTPPLVNISSYLFLVVRVLVGLLQGIAFPCPHALLIQWTPAKERSTLSALAVSGNFVGFAMALPISGFLVDHVGWEAVFYILGSIGLFWCVIWSLVVRSAPENDEHISPEELEYIQNSRGINSQKKTNLPWGQILTSSPVWAIVVTHACDNWGFYTLNTELPAYLNDNFGYSLEAAGEMAAIPYLILALLMIYSGRLADWLKTDGNLTTTQVRKLYCCGAYFLQGVLMLIVAFVSNPVAILTCICCAIGLSGFSWSAFSVNTIDVAPKYASVLMGLSNSAATLCGIISPTITGYIVQNHGASEWSAVFHIAGAMYLLAAAYYAFFGTGEQQSWATTEDRSGEKNRQP